MYRRWMIFSESSPRLWGARVQLVEVVTAGRVIPTPVGSTSPESGIRWNDASHPHACGEHQDRPWPINAMCESSPRLWGALDVLGEGGRLDRVIPTPVGSTARWSSRPEW